MNRANQEALFQQTNQQVLSIRQSEINYYLSLHVAFGTQAALIGGFTYGVFTQNTLNYAIPNVEYVADVYWILCAATIACSVHVILVTMLLQVLAQGLALNGPIGSMAIATEGMRIEQGQVTVSFTMMMIFFAISTVMSFWVSMRIQSATISTIIFIVAARYWYFYCERIYLRFYWDPEQSAWGAGERESDDLGGFTSENPMQRGNLPGQGDAIGSHAKSNKPRSFFQYLTSRGRAGSDGRSLSSRERTSSINTVEQELRRRDKAANAAASNGAAVSGTGAGLATGAVASGAGVTEGPGQKTIIFDGYLTVRSASTALNSKLQGVVGGVGGVRNPMNKQPWERRYFVLNQAGQLYWWKNRQEFRDDPKTPMNTRPLSLSDFHIRVDNLDLEQRLETSATAAATDEDGNVELGDMRGNNVGGADETASVISASVTSTAAAGAGRKGSVLGGIGSTKKNLIPYRFQIALIPRDDDGSSEEVLSSKMRHREDWVLRCDTEDELHNWVQQMRVVSPSSFKE